MRELPLRETTETESEIEHPGPRCGAASKLQRKVWAVSTCTTLSGDEIQRGRRGSALVALVIQRPGRLQCDLKRRGLAPADHSGSGSLGTTYLISPRAHAS